MLVVYAKCIVSGQNVDKFLETAKKLVEETRKEPGNISYDLVQNIQGKNIFAFVEKWPDQEALQIHMKSESFCRLIAEINQLVEGSVEIAVHETVTSS